MRYIAVTFLCLVQAVTMFAQERVVQNRPYTDLRPFHFGILVGTHLQDLEFNNIGPQVITDDQGLQQTYTITTDQDRWDQGFHVGVLGEVRINNLLQFRAAPTLYFGSRHISFHNMNPLATDTLINHSQNLKSVYIGCAADLIFASERFNNHRPYVMMGVNPVINLTGSQSNYLKLKRYDVFLEAGIGCDFYLPFFKLRPELKFMYGLTNSLDTEHANHLKDKLMLPYTQSVNKARSKMIVLTFYFE